MFSLTKGILIFPFI